jgi:hypothetical protein
MLPLLASAQATTTTGTTTDTTSTSTQVNCMQTALEKRETSLMTASDVYASSTKAALTNRLNNLKISLAQTDKKIRIEKRLLAYKTFKTEINSANAVLRNSRNSAWKTYEADAKVCGVKGTGESPSIFINASISL